jgi:uncharacterized protein
MAISLYDISVPPFIRGLTNLSAILAKGEDYGRTCGVNEADLIATRLFDDMHPLPQQIQRASDSAKGVVARIAQLPPVPMDDTEQSFADLQARIAKTLDILKAVTPDQIDGREAQEVVLQLPSGNLTFKALDYVIGFAIPNFYFHVTAAYAILRHRGVPVGKMDYLGPVA